MCYAPHGEPPAADGNFDDELRLCSMCSQRKEMQRHEFWCFQLQSVPGRLHCSSAYWPPASTVTNKAMDMHRQSAVNTVNNRSRGTLSEEFVDYMYSFPIKHCHSPMSPLQIEDERVPQIGAGGIQLHTTSVTWKIRQQRTL